MHTGRPMPFRAWLAPLAAAGAMALLSPAAASQPEDPPAAPEAAAPTTPLAHVEVRGEGPVPMVLIPGLPFDWTVFERFMDRNADRYTMHAVTLPGFGGSEPPPEPPAGTPYVDAPWLENAERAVAAMIRERGLEKPVLVGHSLGAHLAMRIALDRPDLVRSVVAIDGMPAFPLAGPGEEVSREQRAAMVEAGAPQYLRTSDEQFAEMLKQSVKAMVSDPARASALADQAAAVPKATASRYLLELLAADVTDQLPTLKAPMLVIAAVSDQPPPMPQREQVRQTWQQLFEGVPNVTLVFFEDTRHFVTEDAPEALDRAIAQFVAGEPVEGKPAAGGPDAPAEPAPPEGRR